MSKYKVGDKIVLTVSDVNERGYCPYYRFNNNHLTLWKTETDEYTEPLSTYTEPLETKIENLKKKLKRWVEKCANQSTEITRLLAENKELKEDFEKSKRVNLNMGRVAGQNEAWELARKIYLREEEGGYSGAKLFEIFDKISIGGIYRLTYPEAAKKVSEWEKAKEEIKVGDVVKIREGNNNDLCVLCMSTDKKYYNAVDGYGAVYYMLTKEMITKTGRHIDIDSFLKQIGEE